MVERLREDGHDVLAVAEMVPSIPDETVLAQANQRGDLLLMADKDFGGGKGQWLENSVRA